MLPLIPRLVVAALAAGAAGVALAQDTPRYRLRDLNVLTGLDDILAYSINNRGDFTLADNGSADGFLWRGGKLHNLGPFGGTALELNERGDVIGTQPIGGAPILWRNGRAINLVANLPGAGDGDPYDLNERG